MPASHTVATLIGTGALKQVFAPTWPVAPTRLDPVVMLKDVYRGGAGRVTGTVKTKGTPDYAVHRRVRLINERDGAVVRETWSDPVTGVYAFDYVDPAPTYTVLAYDHTHAFRAVVADNLTPGAM